MEKIVVEGGIVGASGYQGFASYAGWCGLLDS